MNPAEIEALNHRLSGAPAEETLRWVWERYGRRAAIGTSFQGAGLVILHLAKVHGFDFPLFTIDTGLLFPETLELRRRLEDFLGRPIEALVPDRTVDQQAADHGPELWRRDPNLCCTLRKVLPLRDRLTQLDAWITGLRRDQSDTRAGVSVVELYQVDDAGSGERSIVKVNPLARWEREAVWEYLRRHQVPYNPLQDQGYRSIGCRPCTAKAAEGGSERAGRWVGFNKTECGIHTFLKPKT